MSIFGDFRKVWSERFPESELPAAWEEDVRSNLLKHRQRVLSLKEELEKEEFYVEYLEQLLADVEKQKTRAAGDGEAATEETSSRTDSLESGIESENSKKFSKSCSQNSIDMCISELADTVPVTEKNAPSLIATPPLLVSSSERSISVDEAQHKLWSQSDPTNRPRSLTQPNLSNFVTVIEVNGVAKTVNDKLQAAKKIPPRPPPKPKVDENKTCNVDEYFIKKYKTTDDFLSWKKDGDIPRASKRSGSVVPTPSSEPDTDNNIEQQDDVILSEKKNEPPYGKIKKILSESNGSNAEKEAEPVLPKDTENGKSPTLTNDPLPEDFVAKSENIETVTEMKTKSEILQSAPEVLKVESTEAESKLMSIENEPFYDLVPVEDSDSDCVIEALTLPSRDILRPSSASKTANYVNIDYFIKQRPNPERSSSVESEEENGSCNSELLRLDSTSDDMVIMRTESTSDCTYASNSSLDSSATKLSGPLDLESDEMQKKIIDSIIDSEVIYLECLSVLLHYMKALKATLSTSQPVISEDELNTVFYKVPQLHSIHTEFLNGLKSNPPYGQHFKKMAENLNDYGAFLHNYGRATDTVKRRSQVCQQFAEITTDIKLKSLQGQSLSLEDLLHKPVARVQKNALVLHDLLKCSSNSPQDEEALRDALSLTQAFLDSFNMIETKKMFGHEDRAQRRLVKNSFMVELCEGHRKLRHLFLFNDVMACAKYKASGRDKFTFELKWYIHLNDLVILGEPGNEPKEVNPPNLIALKSQACTVRDQILRDEEKKRSGLEKQRKKLAALEAQLVLASPDLVLQVGQNGARLYTFLLSSEFERTQWTDTVETLRLSQLPGPKYNNVSMVELQAWVTACRAFLKTNMGSYLLRSGQDESLLRGDLHVRIGSLQGLTHPADLFLVLEVDSYGHYFRKARSKLICRTTKPKWDQDFVIDLEGSQNLRVLLYEEAQDRPIIRGKCTLKLSLEWLGKVEVTRWISLGSGVSLRINLRFSPAEMSVRRVPQGKPSGLFGAKIQHVCKREKREIPFIITSCIREVERRGMNELGIYRVSGSSSDLAKLKKSFESNAYEAEQLLKEVCIHSVTGILKLYLRELPEALFTDHLYSKFLEAWDMKDGGREAALARCYQTLPSENRKIISDILDHLIRVNQSEATNKMSLQNLATVFGPNLIRPSTKGENKQKDLLTASTMDVMAQAGILHHFLTHQQGR